MKKIYLFLFTLLFAWQGYSQVINQNAAWPNSSWTVTGSYNTGSSAFEANPLTSSNFAFDDDDAGNTSDDQIAAESPVINLTAAFNAGEKQLRVTTQYVFRTLLANILRLEYWNADTNQWVAWGTDIPGNNTVVNNEFCTPAKTTFTSTELNFSSFTPTQLAGFKYRIYFNDSVAGSAWVWGFCFDSPTIVSSTPPASAPDCAINPSPANAATGINGFGDVILSWDMATTGGEPTSYDVYGGIDPMDLTFFDNVTETTINAGAIEAYDLTVYWQVIAKNSAGEAIGCAIWSFTTESSPGYCLNDEYGQWPTGAAGYTPNVCDGLTVNNVTTGGFASEYSLVNVTAGETYIFRSSVVTDFITISSDGGLTAVAFGTSPLTWVSNVTGQVRFYTHVSSNCESSNSNRTRSVICGVPPADSPDFVSLQWPPNLDVFQGNSGTVYGRIYEAGLTDTTTGQAAGILAWVGISPEGQNSNPNTWNTWVPATFNVDAGNDDEYQANIGANLVPGTYYYATRFNLNGGAYVYGGINASNPNNGGNFWDGTAFVSGVLVVNPPLPPANDECIDATVIQLDEATCNGTNTNGTNLGATDSGVEAAACFEYGENDVWFSFTVPSNVATVDISTDFLGGTLVDTEIALYAGGCDGLIELACDQDGGETILTNGSSYNSLITNTDVTVGDTYYVRVSGFSEDDAGTFCLKVSTNQLLANDNFSFESLKLYPNPTKNTLNVSYNQEISNVEVYNLVGQRVANLTPNANEGQLDMSNLASGAYFVKVTSNNATKTVKVIKE
jgi:hypothetical protein